MPRLEEMKKSDVVLPNVKPFGYLLNLLDQAGGYSKQISWQDIQAWRSEMNIPLCAWEKETIHKLSQTFHIAVTRYNQENIMSPVAELEAANAPKENISNRLKSALRSVAPNKAEALRHKRKRRK